MDRPRRAQLVALWLLAGLAHSLDEQRCDFASGEGGLSDSHLSLCVRRLTRETKLEVVCPREVRGEISVALARRDIEEFMHQDVYCEYHQMLLRMADKGVDYSKATDDGKGYEIFPREATEKVISLVNDQLYFKKGVTTYNIWDVFGTKEKNVVSKRDERNRQVLQIEPPEDGLLTVKDRSALVYFCAKEQHLDGLENRFYKFLVKKTEFAPEVGYYKLKVPIFGDGDVGIRMGIVIVVLDDIPLVQVGCGNVPTKLFKNLQEFDTTKGYVQCNFSVMSEPHVGFYCEGRLSPHDCLSRFKKLEGSGSPYDEDLISVYLESVVSEEVRGGTFSYANYRPEHLNRPFKGYCDCLDDNDRVAARLVVERNTSHECDIPSLILKNRHRKIKGEWCRVTLHPGDSLKITIPPNPDNDKQIARDREPETTYLGRPPPYSEKYIRLTTDDFSYNQSTSFSYENLLRDYPQEEDLGNADLEGTDDGDGDSLNNDDCSDEFSYYEGELFARREREQEESMEVGEEQDSGISEVKEVNYPFTTVFSPRNPETEVNCLRYTEHLMNKVMLEEVFAGDAYHVDSSEMSRGVVNIEYRKKPLATKAERYALNYYWVLKPRGFLVPDIIAWVKVKLAQTHEYTYGCETEPTGLFHTNRDCFYCAYHFNRCKKRTVKHYTFEIGSTYDYGIYCSDRERLYPESCGVIMIDSKTNEVKDTYRDVVPTEFPSMPNFKLVRGNPRSQQPYTYRCSCLDAQGVELSRLTIMTTVFQLYSPVRLYDRTSYILLNNNVPMFQPKIGPRLGEATDVSNTLPEVQYIIVPRHTPKNKVRLNRGTASRLNSLAPYPLDQCTKVDPKFAYVAKVDATCTLEGVRHEDALSPFTVYTDASLSQGRLFPVNITRYFYRVAYGRFNYLMPTEYSEVLATNVDGLTVEAKTFRGYPDYSNLTFSFPRGGIVIIKQDRVEKIELFYVSGAISKPAVSEEPGPELSCSAPVEGEATGGDGEEEPKPSGSSGKRKERDEGPVRKSRRGVKNQEDVQWRNKDFRRMEIWAIHAVTIYATNPWVHGCGAMEEGEDFFKPETAKIIRDGAVVGCSVDIAKQKIAGFYCPKPYVFEPADCFEAVYGGNPPGMVRFENEPFEDVKYENRAFRYVKLSTSFRMQLRIVFGKHSVYMCKCVTVAGVEVSRIEITV